MMMIRHRWHQEEVQIQQRSSADVSFVTSRIAQSKNRPRQNDLGRRENDFFEEWKYFDDDSDFKTS